MIFEYKKHIIFGGNKYTIFEFWDEYGIVPILKGKEYPTKPSKLVDTSTLTGCWKLIYTPTLKNTFSFGDENVLIIKKNLNKNDDRTGFGTIYGFVGDEINGTSTHALINYKSGALYFGSGADLEILKNGNLKISFLDNDFEEQIFEKIPNEVYSKYINFDRGELKI